MLGRFNLEGSFNHLPNVCFSKKCLKLWRYKWFCVENHVVTQLAQGCLYVCFLSWELAWNLVFSSWFPNHLLTKGESTNKLFMHSFAQYLVKLLCELEEIWFTIMPFYAYCRFTEMFMFIFSEEYSSSTISMSYPTQSPASTHIYIHTYINTSQPDVPHSLLLALTCVYTAITVIALLVSIIKHSHLAVCSRGHINKDPHPQPVTHKQNASCQPSQSNQQKIYHKRDK